MVSILKAQGVKNVYVVPIMRPQWLLIVLGIFTADFWQSSCRPLQLFGFYCKSVDETVRLAQLETGKSAILVGHSAGGWLARAVLSDGYWMQEGKSSDANAILSSDLVLGLVTLGAPHFPPSSTGADMTRGALSFVDRRYPSAHLKNNNNNNKGRGVFYVTVGGGAVMGNSSAAEGSVERFAARSYLQVTGSSSEERGDGVVPLSSTHLPAALQITIKDCWHSIQAPDNRWYGGDPATLTCWLLPTLGLAEEALRRRRRLSIGPLTSN